MPLIANVVQIFLWLGLGGQATSPGAPLRQLSESMGYVRGTLFDSNGAVIVGKVVVLTNLLTGQATQASVDVRGQYHVEVVEGTYELRLENAFDLLPFQRARFRVLARVKSVVNLYPVQRTGFAMTVHGDVRLPDPPVSYDSVELKGPLAGSGLNLVIQYEKRTSLNGSTTYEGRQVVATFDEITVIAQAITLKVDTLTAITLDRAVIDFGPERIAVPRVEVNPGSRLLRIKREDRVEVREF